MAASSSSPRSFLLPFLCPPDTQHKGNDGKEERKKRTEGTDVHHRPWDAGYCPINNCSSRAAAVEKLLPTASVRVPRSKKKTVVQKLRWCYRYIGSVFFRNSMNSSDSTKLSSWFWSLFKLDFRRQRGSWKPIQLS